MTSRQIHVAAPDVVVEDFSYKTLSGQTGKLSQQHDQNIVVHFWATWCVPCQTELPELLRVADGQERTTFLLVSVDEDPAQLQKFLVPYRYLLGRPVILITDPQHIIADQLHVTAYPESFMLSPDLTLRQHLIGPVHWASYPFR